VLDHLDRDDIPVAAGADRPLVRPRHERSNHHGETGLDGPDLPDPAREPQSEHAIDWIARTLSTSREPVTLVATGPLTNVALFLARYTELEAKLERIVVMGGAIGEGNFTPAAEFNVWVDPEAAARVFASGLDLTMVGLDVTYKALMTPGRAGRLAAAGRAGKLFADLYGFYSRVHRERFGWEGAPIHDACALAQVTDRALIETRTCGVRIDTGGELSRGRTNVDRWDRMGWEPNCHVAVDIDSDRFLELLAERIAGLG
jgi:inosine-uridine nucleoside N-ribohydrolase